MADPEECSESAPEQSINPTQVPTGDPKATSKPEANTGFGVDRWEIHASKLKLSKKSCKIKINENSDDGTVKSEIENKKCKMRTASDVISRILWDKSLPSENFVVGYVDRFVGVVEKEFLYFNWHDDLASVDDHDVLVAIPKHRIVYFKYRRTKVWDKNERLDLIFGSTFEEREKSAPPGCENVAISDYVRQLDEEFARNKAEEIEEANEDFDATYNDNDNDDDDDDVELEIMRPIGYSSRVERTPRANYFVAIRITNPDILAKVTELKHRICLKEPRMDALFMSNDLLHITLSMLRLDGPFDVENAVEAIERCKRKLAERFFTEKKFVRVHLEGLSIFRGGQVLYVKVRAANDSDHDRFAELREEVLQLLRESNVTLHQGFADYVPHMTLLKLTRVRAGILQNPFIDPFLYIEDVKCNLGVQACDNLKLCIIGEDKRSDGFYRCDAEVDFK